MMQFWRIVHRKLADPLTFLPFGWCLGFHNWTARKLERAWGGTIPSIW